MQGRLEGVCLGALHGEPGLVARSACVHSARGPPKHLLAVFGIYSIQTQLSCLLVYILFECIKYLHRSFSPHCRSVHLCSPFKLFFGVIAVSLCFLNIQFLLHTVVFDMMHDISIEHLIHVTLVPERVDSPLWRLCFFHILHISCFAPHTNPVSVFTPFVARARAWRARSTLQDEEGPDRKRDC